MLTEEMLAATIDALAGVDRLILCGDPRQLPPIGAGRPFADFVALLRDEPGTGGGVAELRTGRRQSQTGAAHDTTPDDVAVASLFSIDACCPGADEALARVLAGKGDGRIEIVTWNDEADLHRKLVEVLGTRGRSRPRKPYPWRHLPLIRRRLRRRRPSAASTGARRARQPRAGSSSARCVRGQAASSGSTTSCAGPGAGTTSSWALRSYGFTSPGGRRSGDLRRQGDVPAQRPRPRGASDPGDVRRSRRRGRQRRDRPDRQGRRQEGQGARRAHASSSRPSPGASTRSGQDELNGDSERRASGSSSPTPSPCTRARDRSSR